MSFSPQFVHRLQPISLHTIQMIDKKEDVNNALSSCSCCDYGLIDWRIRQEEERGRYHARSFLSVKARLDIEMRSARMSDWLLDQCWYNKSFPASA